MPHPQSQAEAYHSYLLRIWRTDPQQPWHASTQCTATGETQHFASLENLFAFLSTQAQGGEAHVGVEVDDTQKADERKHTT